MLKSVFDKCFENITSFRTYSQRKYNTTDSSLNDIKRRRSLARLGENMYRIQYELIEVEMQNREMNVNAQQLCVQAASEDDLLSVYKRLQELSIQKIALTKSLNILKITYSGVRNQGTLDRLQEVMQKTVNEYKMVEKNGLLDTANESLLQSFENMTDQFSMDTGLVSTMEEKTNEMISSELESEAEMSQDLRVDSGFNEWRNKLQVSIATSQPRVTDSYSQPNQVNSMPKPVHLVH